MSEVKAETRSGDPIARGDTVSFVHFGELHEAVVDAIGAGIGDMPTIVAKIEARVPAFAASIVKRAHSQPKTETPAGEYREAGPDEKPGDKTPSEKPKTAPHSTHTTSHSKPAAKSAEKGKN